MFLISIHILVFALQAAVLDFFLLDLLGLPAWVFVGIDALLLAHMLFGYREKESATKGVLQWGLYAVTFTAKLCVYYFIVFEGRLEKNATYYSALGGIGYDVSAEIMVLTRSYAFFMMIYLAPLLFAFWLGRGAREVFSKADRNVTIESLIYCDIAVHVILDLVDCCTAFRFSAYIYDFRGRHSRMEKANGIIMAIGIICHSISLPSFSSNSFAAGSQRSAQIESVEKKDIYLTRKFVALVSAFVIDVPLLITRVFFWLNGYGFQVFIVKNLISIPLSIFRLNYTTYQENREAGKSSVAVAKPGAAAGAENSAELLNAVLNMLDEEEHEKILPQQLSEWVRCEKPLFPVTGAPLRGLVSKVIQCATAGGRHSVCERLDAGLVLPYWKATRLAAALLLHWTCSIAAISILSFWTKNSVYCTDITCEKALLQWWGDQNDPSWFALSILALAAATVNLLLHLGTVNILDSLFTSCLYLLRSYTLWWSIWSFRKLGIFDINQFVTELFGPVLSRVTDSQLDGVTLFVICGANGVFALMQGLFFVQSAFLSRRFIYYALQPHSRTARQLASDGKGRDPDPKTDECGWISTASILAFLTCKAHIGPMDYHQLLIGPNVIRGVRLSDMLLVTDWMTLIMSIVFRGFAMMMYGYDNVLLLLCLLYVGLEVCYIVVSQTIRLLSIRRFQIKALYTDIVKEWASSTELDHKRKMDTLAKVLVRYRREAFLTSPGEVLPPLL